jgi:hypothetical protein
VALLGTSQHPSSVTVGGQALMDVQSPENLSAAAASAYYWNSSIQITFIKIFDAASSVVIVAS